MQPNQHSGCAMMAMGCFSAEVFETGVDPYRLGRGAGWKLALEIKQLGLWWPTNLQAQDCPIQPGPLYRNNMNNIQGSWQPASSTHNIFWAINCPACHLETYQFRYHPPWWFQWEQFTLGALQNISHCQTSCSLSNAFSVWEYTYPPLSEMALYWLMQFLPSPV